MQTTHRFATVEDTPILAELNQQLLEDEGHRLRRTLAELQLRMEEWMRSRYEAVLFENEGKVVGYVLYRTESDQIYLRQLLVVRGHRRKGLGREFVRLLRNNILPKDKRLTVEVLVTNTAALCFWRALGLQDYSLMLEALPHS